MTIWDTIKNADKNPPKTWDKRNNNKGHEDHKGDNREEPISDELAQQQENILNSLMQKIEELKNK